MSDPRYAIYFVPAPESPFYQLGAKLLGYDAYTGKRLPFPDELAVSHDEWLALTREPRTYGFHATLKAPFRLAPERREDELAAQLKAVAGMTRERVAIVPALRRLGGFAALVPDAPCPPLDRLAADCVQAFEEFRAPLNADERRKRLAAPLNTRHKENLERWGYPYVFEDFRFHMTLTGEIAPARYEAVLGDLRRRFSAIEGKPLPVDRVALLLQPDRDAPFHLVASAPLSAR